MKKRVFIHLPNGQKFEFADQKETITEDHIGQMRSFFQSATSMNANVFSGPNFDQKMALILWGELLQNSFITIE